MPGPNHFGHQVWPLTRWGPNCAYLSLPALGVGPSRLPGKPEGEPSGRGITQAFAGTLPTLPQRYSSTPLASRWCHVMLAQPQPVDRLGP
jgi:hypothetical protein